MAKRSYHPGRRKRRTIMHERAFAVVFGFKPEERQVKFPAELRDLLEAMVDVDAAYNGQANMDRCIVAGEKALGKSTTHVSSKIAELKGKGFVRFEPYFGGARLIIEDSTLDALVKLEKFAWMIDTTTRIEDRGGDMTPESSAILQELRDESIYVGQTDQDLDDLMRGVVDPIVDERRAYRALQKEQRMKMLAERETTGLKQACGFVAAALLATSMFVGAADAAMADRGGTVGLILLSSYQP